MGEFMQSAESSKTSSSQVKEWTVKYWSERRKRLFGDCFEELSMSKYGSRDQFNIPISGLKQLQSLWAQIKSEGLANIFTEKYGGIASLLSVEVDVIFLRAALEFWDSSYRCFSSKEWDLTPTLEEYSALLNLPFVELPPKLFMWTPRKPEWYLCQLLNVKPEYVKGHISRNRSRRCVSKDLFMPFIRRHIKEEQGLRAFALLVYGLVIFPTAPGMIDLGVIYFFERVQNGGVQPVPSILAETFRALNYCRENSVGNLYACPQLLTLWFQGHLPGSIVLRSSSKRTKHEWMITLYRLSA